MKLKSISSRVGFATLIGLLSFVTMIDHAFAQPGSDEEMIELNFSGTTNLPKFIEAFSKILDTKFIYGSDSAMQNRPVNVVTPTAIPRSAIEPFFGSVLKSHNLAIVDSTVPGWKRIEDYKAVKPLAEVGDADEVLLRDGPAAFVTQVLEAKNLDVNTLKTHLDKFKSDGGEIIAIPDNGVFIVTDYTGNVQKIADLIRLIDETRAEATIDFYEVQNRTPASLRAQAEALLSEDDQAQTKSIGEARLFDDSSGKRIVVAGAKDKVARVIQLLRQLDTGTDFITRMYRIENTTAARIDALIKGLVSTEELEKSIETTVDEEGNVLIVRAPETVHLQIKKLLIEFDRPIGTQESPYQFYKLRNANATEVLFTLLALQQVTGTGQVLQAGGLGGGAFGTLGGLNVGGLNPALGLGLGGFPGMTGLGGANQTLQMPPGNNINDDSNNGTNLGANRNGALGSVIGANTGGLGGLTGGLGGLTGDSELVWSADKWPHFLVALA